MMTILLHVSAQLTAETGSAATSGSTGVVAISA